MMQCVLIIGYVWPEPRSSAAGNRMVQLIELFAEQGWEIVFSSPAQKGENKADLSEFGVREETIVLNDASFDDFVKLLQPTLVLFDRFMMEEQFGWRVALHCPNALRVLDTEDLHCLRKTRHKAVKAKVPFQEEMLLSTDLAKREIASIYRCDLSLMVSTYEMQLLQTLFKVPADLLFYLPILVKETKTLSNDWSTFDNRKDFITVGNFLHAPNVDGVLMLKKNIWPMIRKTLPKAVLHVYGAYPTQQVREWHQPKEGFLVHGFIEDAETEVSKARLVLAPLRFGAGIKGKLLEAMQCGTPSITTSIGAEGMSDHLPWNGAVCEDFSEFAHKAVALYKDKIAWQTAQQNGEQLLQKRYERSLYVTSFVSKLLEIQEQLSHRRTQNFIGALLQHHSLQSTRYLSKWIEEKNKKG